MATPTPMTGSEPSIPKPSSLSSIYKPLNTSAFEIRLLIIPFSVLRNLGQEDPEPLSGRLVHHRLPIGSGSTAKKFIQAVKRRNYTALSYVWGSPVHTHEIIIDGQNFPITHSLYSAIRQLQCDFLYRDEAIWVDAICIDQSNNIEKSAQISIMREVYHNAGTVRVWLGPVRKEDEDNIYQVMQWIQILNNGFVPDKYESGSNEWWEEKYLPLLTTPFGIVAHTTLSGWHKINMFKETFNLATDEGNGKVELWEPEDAERFTREFLKWRPKKKDLEAFMKLVPAGDLSVVAEGIERYIIREPEWFTRIWVVQEVGVAWDDVEVARGTYSSSWNSLLTTIFYLHYTCNIHFPSIDKVTRLEILRLGFRDGKRSSLRELMHQCRFRQATNPRDKVYGLYGLMGDKANIFTKPDYSKSIEEVYAHTTLHFITQAMSLNAICGQQRVAKRQGLPSWVPDYELDLAMAPESLLPRDSDDPLFHASGYDGRAEYELLDPEVAILEWTLLHTEGIQIGVVTHLSEISNEGETLSQIQSKWRKTLDDYFLTEIVQPKQVQLSSLDGVAEQINQYSAFHSSSVSSSSRKMDTSQTSTPLPMSRTSEIDTTDSLTLAYLSVLTTTRDSPIARASPPYLTLLPPSVPSQTRSSPPAQAQSQAQNSRPASISPSTRSSKYLFTIPRKPLNPSSDRAATMPSLLPSSDLSPPTGLSTPTTISISTSAQPTSTNINIPAVPSRNLITSSRTTTATDHTTIFPQDAALTSKIKETCLALEAGMRRKRFFVMGVTDGEGEVKLASGPEEMRVGDVVVVFYGCDVPVVLREVGGVQEDEWEDVEEEGEDVEGGGEDSDGSEEVGGREDEKERKWEFVGEAFVEGFMDAEALAWLVRGRGEVEDFDLV